MAGFVSGLATLGKSVRDGTSIAVVRPQFRRQSTAPGFRGAGIDMAVRVFHALLAGGLMTGFWTAHATYTTSGLAPCSRAAAYERVKDGLRQRLVAPSGAVFPDLDGVRIEAAGACAWRVSGFVDASNMLGVLLRADFDAHVGPDAEGRMQMRLDALRTRGTLDRVLPAPGATDPA
jgi:hypothetical protein